LWEHRPVATVDSLASLEEGAALVDAAVVSASEEEGRFAELSFDRCHFQRCAFQGTGFEGCEFVDCLFEDCDLSNASWRGSRIAGGEFRRCKLLGVNWALPDWRSAALHGPPSFVESRLTDGFAESVPWREVRFHECEMGGMDFADADLRGASFAGCGLAGVRFERTKLDRADFRGARDYVVDVRTASIEGARFDLPAAVGLLEALPIEIE
jgi:uncharacterized protein YjbI with pentapeptide repeats